MQKGTLVKSDGGMTATSMREVYEQGAAAFVPSPDDNADAIPFYRAWAGLRAAWGEDFCKDFNAAVHNAACAAGWAKDGERYQAALVTLRSLADAQKPAEEPRYNYTHWTAPSEPTERDARELFNAEFKRAYPSKRANSKEANVKYAQVRDKAFAIVRERYTQALAEYKNREDQTARENAARRKEWINKLHSMALFENAVRDIWKDDAP